MEDKGAGDAIDEVQKIIGGAKGKETVRREEDKQIAEAILATLGQANVPQRLWDYFGGKDIINRFGALLNGEKEPLSPDDLEKEKESDILSIIKGLTEYLPDNEEILSLVETAMVGAVKKKPDGTFISFRLAKKGLKMSGIASGGGIKTSEQVTDFEATNSMAFKIMTAFSDTQNAENGNIFLLNPARTLKMTVGARGKRDSSEKPYMRTIDVKRF